MEKYKKVAVVILNYNGKKYLNDFLPSVLASTYPNMEIIVADNASSDDSLAFVKDYYPTIKLLSLSKNHGFADGYNQALKHIQSDYYILLNSDIEVEKDWIQPLVTTMEGNQNVAAVQPKIRSFHRRDSFEHAGAAGGFLDVFAYPFCRGRIFSQTEIDSGQYDDAVEIFWASGAALCIDAQLFHAIGGFDGDYFAHMEEIDLCWRLKRAGYKIMYAPESVVYHVGGGTLDYGSPLKVFLNFRNSLYTIVKNESWARLSWFFLFRLILDGIAGIVYATKFRFDLTWQILRSHFACYAQFSSLFKKKNYYNQCIESCRVASENNIARVNFSIIWSFYIRKKKFFTSLK